MAPFSRVRPAPSPPTNPSPSNRAPSIVPSGCRWTLLTALVAGGVLGEADIAAEERRDATATGRERGARARAAIPTPEAKRAAWERVFTDDALPNQMVDAVLAGWATAPDEGLLTAYITEYHDRIRALWEARTYAISESVALGAYPIALASPQLLAATQAWLDANEAAPAGLRRLVAENSDSVDRAVHAQERDGRA